MMNSDARKRQEEGWPVYVPRNLESAELPVLTCVACGHTGEGVMYYYHGRTRMCGRTTAFACLERIARAKSCLEPVTQE